MGEQAATAMVQLLGGGDFESVEVIPELVIRQSSEMKR
jgi:DNA-binding LacI/PurR family transcriptional regulator